MKFVLASLPFLALVIGMFFCQPYRSDDSRNAFYHVLDRVVGCFIDGCDVHYL